MSEKVAFSTKKIIDASLFYVSLILKIGKQNNHKYLDMDMALLYENIT